MGCARACGGIRREIAAMGTIAFVSLNVSAFAEPMSFTMAGNGGNCTGCDWLAADGDIMPDSADQLLALLKKEKESWFGLDWHGTVVLNSRGGNLFGGIKLGEAIRAQGMSTEVGRTIADAYGHQQHEKGQCASACVFAFLGGVSRTAKDNELGVHQFYQEAALSDPKAKVFSAIDFSNQQLVSAVVLDYAVKMGADPGLVSRASKVPPSDIEWLSAADAVSLKAIWHPEEFEPWAIEPYGKGIVAFSKTRNKLQTATIFCRADRIPRLLLSLDAPDDPSIYTNNWPSVSSASAFNSTVARADMTFKVSHGKGLWELALRNFDPSKVQAGNTMAVNTFDFAPHVAWGYFQADLNFDQLQPMARAALRNCL